VHRLFNRIRQLSSIYVGNCKVLLYSLPSVGPGTDPGVQAVSPQVNLSHPPGSGCHYFPPDLRLPSQPKSVTAHRPVPNYTAWWQRNLGVNNLPKVIAGQRGGRGSNSRPLSHQSDALASRQSSHPISTVTAVAYVHTCTVPWPTRRKCTIQTASRYLEIRAHGHY